MAENSQKMQSSAEPSPVYYGNQDNVTTRKQHKVGLNIENSYESSTADEDDEYPSFILTDNHNRSLPLQSNEKEKIEELETLVKTLQEKLASAENEIENILTENSSLKIIISNNEKTINNLKKICHSTPKKGSKIKRKSINMSMLNYTREENQEEHDAGTNMMKLQVKLVENNGNIFSNTGIPDSITLPDIRPNESSQVNLKHVIGNINTEPSKHNDSQRQRDSAQPITQEINIPSKKIIIIGGSQCRNLASALIKSRNNTKYEKYNIQSLIYPEASTEFLSEACEAIQLDEHDKLVLSVGEEDTDPQKIFHELYHILKKIKCSVLLLPVRKNKYLNENKLNYYINCVSKMFEKSYCIKPENNPNKYYHIKNVCFNINLVVDAIDYNHKFIPKKRTLVCKMKTQNQNVRTTNKLISRQKAITEYFSFVKKNSTKNNNSIMRNNSIYDDVREVKDIFFRL